MRKIPFLPHPEGKIWVNFSIEVIPEITNLVLEQSILINCKRQEFGSNCTLLSCEKFFAFLNGFSSYRGSGPETIAL